MVKPRTLRVHVPILNSISIGNTKCWQSIQGCVGCNWHPSTLDILTPGKMNWQAFVDHLIKLG